MIQWYGIETESVQVIVCRGLEMYSPTDYRDELHAAIAEALGMGLLDLETAFVKGHTVQSLAESRGYDLVKVRAAVKQVHRRRIERAADEGDLSREQADQLLRELDLSDTLYTFGDVRSPSRAEPTPRKPRPVAHRI